MCTCFNEPMLAMPQVVMAHYRTELDEDQALILLLKSSCYTVLSGLP